MTNSWEARERKRERDRQTDRQTDKHRWPGSEWVEVGRMWAELEKREEKR